MLFDRAIHEEAGWYRGDFHTHTHYSDGILSPSELVNLAIEEGLDFIAVTDHNTFGSFSEFGENRELLVIPGIEVTTDLGHFNLFGFEYIPAWLQRLGNGKARVRLEDHGFSTSLFLQLTSDFGLFNSINHPLLKPWEWRDPTTSLRFVQGLEVWNDPTWLDNQIANPMAVDLWTAWLNKGIRVTAIGGSDFHSPYPSKKIRKPLERVGIPSTYVYAQELSGAGILEGLLKRHVYISMGPVVDFQLKVDGDSFLPGSNLGERNCKLDFHAKVISENLPVSARIVKNGRCVFEHFVNTFQSEIRYQERVAEGDRSWYRLDLMDKHEKYVALTNPFFIGSYSRSSEYIFGDFSQNQSKY